MPIARGLPADSCATSHNAELAGVSPADERDGSLEGAFSFAQPLVQRDQPARIELRVDLGQQLPQQAQLVAALAKSPDRAAVQRLLAERDAAKAADDRRSRTASSAPGSDSPRHCRHSTILNIVSGG
jgi:hypothetical protein